MQAQAAGGNGEGMQGLLQNPKVQIGVIAVGAIAIIVVIWLLFFNNSAAPAPIPVGAGGPGGLPMSPDGAPIAPGAPGVPGDPMMAMPGAPGMAGAPGMGMPGAPGMAGPGMAGPGGAPGAAAEGATKAKGPGVPTRKNPFAETDEIKKVVDSIPLPPEGPVAMAQPHSIYVDELHKPPTVVALGDDEDTDGPPIPTMRVAGVVYGKQVSATLQIGEQYIQVTPGQMVPASNPLYRIDRIEQEKVFLSRRWETGSGANAKKGVQRIEVGLTARAASQGGGAFGMPGGYPGGGYPGGAVPGF